MAVEVARYLVMLNELAFASQKGPDLRMAIDARFKQMLYLLVHFRRLCSRVVCVRIPVSKC